MISSKNLTGGGRKSNFELLRLVAMLFIVCGHVLEGDLELCGYTKPFHIEQDGWVGISLFGIFIIGVNIFVAISGWFGIRRVWSQVIRLVLDVALYGTIMLLLCWLIGGQTHTLHDVFHGVTFHHRWFVAHYLILVLVSPLIEKALEGIALRRLTYWVVLLTIVNIGLGWWLYVMNTNGYNAVHLAYVYVLARWLRMVQPTEAFRKFARMGLLITIVVAALLAVGYVIYTSHRESTFERAVRYYGYNNPLIVLSSLAFVAWFSRFSFQSRAVNVAAKATFGIYLLHGASAYNPFRNAFARSLFAMYGWAGFVLAALGIYVSCLLVSLLIEWLKGKVSPLRWLYALGERLDAAAKKWA